MPLICDQCDAKLKVTVTGGEFFVQEESTPDNINFERAENTKIIMLSDEPEKEKDIRDLTVTVTCSANADHLLFSHTVSKIKANIYSRIALAATKNARKYS